MILLMITCLHFLDHDEDNVDDVDDIFDDDLLLLYNVVVNNYDDADHADNDDLPFLDHQSSLIEAEAAPRSFAWVVFHVFFALNFKSNYHLGRVMVK